MKKVIALLIILSVMSMASMEAFAGRYVADETYSDENWIDTDNISEKEISFRNLQWYQTKAIILDEFNELNIQVDDSGNSFFCDNILGYVVSLQADKRADADEAISRERDEIRELDKLELDCTTVAFKEDNLAGHQAKCRMYFVNPINNNSIERNSEDARFVFAKYTIVGTGKFTDVVIAKINRELFEKLTSIYGESFSYSKRGNNAYWKDSYGGRIVLDDLDIIYVAPGILEKTEEEATALKLYRERQRQEELERQSSTNGL